MAALALPIEVGEQLMGALSVYGATGLVDESLGEVGEILAATLGAVFHEMELNADLHRLGEDMQRALSSRAVIEQAKGIVMAQRGCTADAAFAHLATLSSSQERKLRDVARSIVDGISEADDGR